MQLAKRVLHTAAAAVLASALTAGFAGSSAGNPNRESTGELQLAASETGRPEKATDAMKADDGFGGSDSTSAAEAATHPADEAAAANDAIERAAMDALPVPPGDPIVPQRIPDRPDIEDGSEPDPLASTAPPATGYAIAVAGTRSAITFDDAGLAASDVALTPHLQLEVGTAARSRFVALDAADLSSALDAAFVTIELFGGVTVKLATDVAPSTGALGSSMYSGGGARADAFTDVRGATVESDIGIITILGGRVAGDFWADGKQYGLRTVADGLAVIYEVAREFPDEDLEQQEMMKPGPDNGPSGLTADELGVDDADIIGLPAVEVMVAYDNEAFAYYGSQIDNVRAEVAAMVNLTNQTYRNTDQEQQMNLTGLYATNVTPNTTSAVTYRNQLASKTDGNFDGVHSARDAQGADFVVLLSNRFVNFGLCGIAFFPTSSNPAENDAYNVTETSCAITGLTFPHELGHNQCAAHDNTGSNLCNYTNSLGFVDAGANKRTIMARNSQPGIRQPVWSKNGHVYEGWTHGDATHNNAAALEIEDLGGISGGVANYRVGNGTATSVAGIDGNSCIYGTLEQAFANAPTGSTIYVAPGTYPAQSSGLNYNVSRAFDIEQGTAQCEPTTSGAATNVVLQLAAGSTVDAVLEIAGGSTVRLERITVEGGNSAEGTVRVLQSSDLTLDGAVIRNGNNPSTTLGGGGLRIDAGSSATMINNGQIVNNTAVNGGGVYVNGGTFTIDDTDDVENNNATDGGGIYATGNATVIVRNNGDVLSNTATSDGGGVHLTGDADLEVYDAFSFVGGGSEGNTASRGGGVFIDQGSTGSKVTIRDGGAVNSNSANFGAGVYLLNGELEVNAGGAVQGNTGGNGGGILAVNSSTTVDLNPGAQVSGNTGGVGAGIFMSSRTLLQANQAQIQNNASTSNGGGLFVSQAENHTISDSILSGNSAVNGGGIYNNGSTISTLVNTTLSVNSATGSGGDIVNVGSGRVSLIPNSAISDSTAADSWPTAPMASASEQSATDVQSPAEHGPSAAVRSSVPAPTVLFYDELPAALRQRLAALGVEPGDLFDIQSSADGEEVVFATEVALIEDDDNGLSDIYRYRAGADDLSLLSRTWAGGTANGPSDQPRIDGWGEYVVYRSGADNLTETPDTNQVDDIYLADLRGGLSYRISWNARGEEAATPSAHPGLGGEDLLVVYEREDGTGQRGIYADDQESILAQRQDPGDCDAHHPALSADASLLAYVCGEPDSPGCVVRFIERFTGALTTADCPSGIEGDYGVYFDEEGEELLFAPVNQP